MTNEDRYAQSFIGVFGVDRTSLQNLKYQDVPDWDSVGHMALMADLESTFGIEMDIDDIIDFSSYETGKAILSKYGVNL